MVRNYIKFVTVLIILLMTCYPVLAIYNADGYEMKYKDYNPTKTFTESDITGGLIINIRAGGSAQDLLVFISRDGTNVSPIDNTYRPDGIEIPNQNPGYRKIYVQKDGFSEIIRLVPGNYTAYLRNGNSGQPEQQSFYIGAKGMTYVNFLGHAVSSKHIKPVTKKLEIIKALYGFDESCKEYWVEEVNHTVHHPAITHNITVVDKEAWDEYIYHPEVNHTEWVNEINHTVYHPATTHIEYRTVTKNCYYVYDWKYFRNDGWKVKCTNHKDHGEGWHVENSNCHKCEVIYGEWSLTNPCEKDVVMDSCKCEYETRIVIDKEAWTEIIVDIPGHYIIVIDEVAWTEIIHHPAETHEETIVDEEAWDEIVVDVPGHYETICTTPYVKDVTSIVSGLVKNNELHIKSSDYLTLFGDTNMNLNDKSDDQMYGLYVTYSIGGKVYNKHSLPSEDMNIP